MVGIAILLAFVIWVLGQALITLSRQVVDKTKSSNNNVLAIAIMLGLIFMTQTADAQTAEVAIPKVLPGYGSLSSITYYLLLSVICAEMIAILFLSAAVKSMFAELSPRNEVARAYRKVPLWKGVWSRLDKKFFTKAIPVEREANLLLDHDYDGIRELDNALPPWWKYGFYFTIVVAVIYMFNFHVFGTGKNPTEEYALEMQNAQVAKELYEANNKDKIDENNVPLAGADGLTRAKEIFVTKCWPCHGKLGEGGAGPNLTDNYWLHKGSLNDIYLTIKTGYPDKGMQSWAAEYTPKEISFLASFIKSLQGTNPPNPKAPQGELYNDSTSAPAKSKNIDSTSKNISMLIK